jgi:hypothetical protein
VAQKTEDVSTKTHHKDSIVRELKLSSIPTTGIIREIKLYPNNRNREDDFVMSKSLKYTMYDTLTEIDKAFPYDYTSLALLPVSGSHIAMITHFPHTSCNFPLLCLKNRISNNLCLTSKFLPIMP